MEQDFDIPRMLVLRKLTNAIAEYFERRLMEQLANLAPLLNPKMLLGEHIRGGAAMRDSEKAFRELSKIYQSIAPAKPFQLEGTLKPPLDIFNTVVETTPAEYAYVPAGSGPGKRITIISPLKWTLSYKGMGPQRLRELIGVPLRTDVTDLQACILHTLVMHLIMGRRPGVAGVLEALRFPVSSSQSEEFGHLPLTCISCPVSTMRPPDEVIIQSTEISGSMAFAEVVNLEDIARMSDPLRDHLLEIVKSHDEKLLSEISPAIDPASS